MGRAQNLGRTAEAEDLAWLDRDYARPLAVAELARRAHTSKSTLCRLFRRCLGRSPLDYVIDLRLRAAAERLREGDPIAAIAAECGFADPNYFARLFRARYGRSPRAWRAALKPPSAGSGRKSEGKSHRGMHRP